MYRRLSSAVCALGAALARTYGRTGWAAFVVELGELENTHDADPGVRYTDINHADQGGSSP